MPNESVTREHLSTRTSASESTDEPRRPSASPTHPSGLAIIGSKIGPAAPARSVLARPRLVDWFGQHAHARLILINAEAGYGKTTLLSEFANDTRDRVVWYRLERSDGDWITFLSYLTAALRDIWPDFGQPTEALLRNVAALGSSREVVLAQFLADLSSASTGRVAVILDDYHLVGESPDVRMIVSRMLERAPEGMYFILSGRGTPNLAVGRLMGQGRVQTLNIDDLRFTLSEIEQLFARTYGQPLDDEACQIIAERTEGWAAGLQLVAASMAVSQPHEVGDFIRALSGAKGPIYDFLAEEVLTRLLPETQRVLMHASLVDRVLTEYVTVALEAGGTSYGQGVIEAALDRAESLGLLGARGEGSGGRRMQALFREFLQVHLEREVPSESILGMHLALAQASEQDDWLMAARHYANAQDPLSAMHVLGSAAGDALGTGAWGAVVEIVEMMPSTPPPTAVKVIQARALISDKHPQAAIELLQSIDRSSLTADERGLVSLTWAAIHHMNGESGRLHDEVDAIVSDASVPSLLRDVGVSWQLMLQAASGGSVADAVAALRLMASEQSKLDLHYFAGVTLHNASAAELASGKFREAIELGDRSLYHLARTDEHSSIAPSTQSIQAAALAEQGDLEEGLRLAAAAATGPDATADAIAEAAYLHAVCGRTQRGRTLLVKFDRGDARWARDPSSQALGWYARYALAMSSGSLDSARLSLEAVDNLTPFDFDSKSRQSVLAATLAVSSGSPDAADLVDRAKEMVTQQNAWRWMIRVRILDAIVQRDGESLALWISEAESDSALSILELADAIATAVGSLAPVPQALERSILREPTRWVGALSRQVRGIPSEDAGAAAALVARYGTADDAHLLREYERGPSGRPKRRGLATQLVRRVSPTVRVHDLGLTSYDIGDRTVHLTETRRKTAALLLYLVTRPDLAANREQVMEALWPDQTPKSALNSLHQTIFVLRRELEPWYEDGATADYVHMDTELVRLDRELFQVDSVAFARQAADIAATGTAGSRGPELLALYRGQFAPEFEYDEWAAEWRTHLHTSYLHLAHTTASSLVGDRRYGEAVEVLTPVVGLDSTAFELRGTLVGCLAAAGARDASVAHYRSMAVAHERDLGLPARPYQEYVDAVSAMP